MTQLLLVTASLHYLAIIPFLVKNKYTNLTFFNRNYVNTIFLSTTMSIIWHYFNILKDVDYSLAGIWFIQDIMWGFLLNKEYIINLNILIYVLNIISDNTNNYVLYHSIWHKYPDYKFYINSTRS